MAISKLLIIFFTSILLFPAPLPYLKYVDYFRLSLLELPAEAFRHRTEDGRLPIDGAEFDGELQRQYVVPGK